MQELSLPDISSFAAPVYIFFILVEIVLVTMKRAQGLYETRDASASILMGAGSVASELLFKSTLHAGLFAILFAAYELTPLRLGHAWWVFLLALLLDDLRYYWSHRWQHEIRWGWANHIVHHSSQHYNFTTALRQPWLGFLNAPFFFLRLPLVLIGIHPGILAFVYSVNLFYQFFIHTETIRKLPPWIEAIFNTPSHHRVHHGRNAKYLDCNYAGILIIWDKIFGTFVAEDDKEPARYGIVHSIGTFNPIRIAAHEYIAIVKDILRPGLSWRQRLLYLIGRPGWSHDATRQTSAQIKADFVQRHPHRAGEAGLPTGREAAAIRLTENIEMAE
ncbi:MAG: sterol desaturase family protein [bacterium]